MRFCGSCGKKIPENAKFCVHCGTRWNDVEKAETPEEPVKKPRPSPKYAGDQITDTAFKLMSPGEDCCGYRVVRLLNKDPEGIKYIVEKDGKQYILKLFFKYKYSDLESIITLQNRLKRLGTLESAHTAKVAEVNETHDPVFMAAEFVDGDSLSRIKENEPERLNEEFVRKVAIQLTETAIAVRKQGLTMHELTPSGIMLSEDEKNITILTSGIKYEEVDEREEVFNIGVILAQLLSGNVLYKSLYSADNLRVHKFVHIPGVTVALNKILADCLHRNILQRHTSLELLLKGLKSLPSTDKCEVFAPHVSSQTLQDLQDSPLPPPKKHMEWTFWLAIGLIVAGIAAFFIWGMPAILKPGGLAENIASLFSGQPDSLNSVPLDEDLPGRSEKPTRANEFGQSTLRDDPRKRDPQTVQPRKRSQQSSTVKTSPSPDRSKFVRVPDGTFGFGRLKDNPNHNVFVSGFWISKYEVTQAEWEKYMMPASLFYVSKNLPVENVSWMDIIRYCNARSEAEGLDPVYKIAASVTCDFSKNGYRLPTEAEWEMAAKAGTLFDYSGSDDPDEYVWHRDNSGRRYRRGGEKKPNAYGIYDMSGNVAEWVWDWYDAKYPAQLSEFTNPRGPSSGGNKVIRGGSVDNGIGTNLKILYRMPGNPGRGYQFVGFRVVRSH
ncbi:MAG: SUMF1/EgtB/PvdO family nonheme iron enzyme [Candidatus Cloacimonadaceae bacterium]|jgi:formylglycine-generating enzyme required for sulfatase activity|nr:SUMF1/EgtB/PvdO family nonheme iron enzyme [Candidatus Cloacimonadota bacterium]MDX9949981.1 SUMF1/EgtB/PvdO family nonheme iron enzyme [Candidatus Syntrophosphaera sp.]NLN85629.1 SUMF1/EgtB/PvdO family nonheme iron enzyme [Candidatus Cloacimonadota bacterium]